MRNFRLRRVMRLWLRLTTICFRQNVYLGLISTVAYFFHANNFTRVRMEKKRDSGNQPLAAPMYVRS